MIPASVNRFVYQKSNKFPFMQNHLQSRQNKSKQTEDDPLLERSNQVPYIIRHNIVRKGYIFFETTELFPHPAGTIKLTLDT